VGSIAALALAMICNKHFMTATFPTLIVPTLLLFLYLLWLVVIQFLVVLVIAFVLADHHFLHHRDNYAFHMLHYLSNIISISTNAYTMTGRFNGKTYTPIAGLACISISRSYHARIKSEKPLATAAVLVNPSTVFIITLTCSHAATFSRLPSSRLRLPNIDKQQAFAVSILH
jgi:hypothetical protein